MTMKNQDWHRVSYDLYGERKYFDVGDYTILYNAKTGAFVVAFKYDHDDGTWGQGHYFDDIYSALEFFVTKTNG